MVHVVIFAGGVGARMKSLFQNNLLMLKASLL